MSLEGYVDKKKAEGGLSCPLCDNPVIAEEIAAARKVKGTRIVGPKVIGAWLRDERAIEATRPQIERHLYQHG